MPHADVLFSVPQLFAFLILCRPHPEKGQHSNGIVMKFSEYCVCAEPGVKASLPGAYYWELKLISFLVRLYPISVPHSRAISLIPCWCVYLVNINA